MTTLIYETRKGKRKIEKTDVEFLYEDNTLYLSKGDEGGDYYWEESFDGHIGIIDHEHLEFFPYNYTTTEDISTVIIVFNHLNVKSYLVEQICS